MLPHFDPPLFVGKPNVGDREHFDQLVDEIFQRSWFTNNGEVVQEFEKQLCERLRVKHCITVCNATIGLQIACHALGLSGEIIMPSFTFVATPHSVTWEGLTPVFCDIDPSTHLMDPSQVETLITERTTAILGVHAWGAACHPHLLQTIADRNGLLLYFDAAHAFGCQLGNTMIGNFGECEVFSFHATKLFNTFEGGAITTNDDELAQKLRLMINFGFEGVDKVVHLGTNGKMSEIHAAMGLAGLRGFSCILERNKENYLCYRDNLRTVTDVSVFDYGENSSTNYQYVPIELPGELRDYVMERLHQQGIYARRYFFPGCHRMAPYSGNTAHSPSPLAATEKLCDEILLLPTGSSVSHEDVEKVCSIIKSAIESFH